MVLLRGRSLVLKKGLGGANSFYRIGESGAKTFSKVKNGFAPARGYNEFVLALRNRYIMPE